MRRRVSTVSVLVVLVMAFTSAALADSVSGGGQTPLSASLGFNVHSDLKGELNYNADPNGVNAGFSAHCSTFTSYVSGTTKDGFPSVTVAGTCTDKDGNPLRIKAQFVDRGEPGKNDSVCIIFVNPSGVIVVHDHGTLLSGNIQIKTDPANAGGTMAEILAT